MWILFLPSHPGGGERLACSRDRQPGVVEGRAKSFEPGASWVSGAALAGRAGKSSANVPSPVSDAARRGSAAPCVAGVASSSICSHISPSLQVLNTLSLIRQVSGQMLESRDFTELWKKGEYLGRRTTEKRTSHDRYICAILTACCIVHGLESTDVEGRLVSV